ncbi:MAG TPA: hypothetical protein VEK08_14350 [Planctomycetota bacterium]|nr:hypothetical protein [Planctomycetota bacterium]
MSEPTKSEERNDRIELPKTFLSFCDGVLQKTDGDGKVVTKLNLCDISKITLTWRTDTTPVVVAFVSAALAYAAYVNLEQAVWKYSLTVLLALVALICAAAANQAYLILESRGDQIEYNLNDSKEDCQGFVVTLKRAVEDAKAAEKSGKKEPAVLKEAPPAESVLKTASERT